MMPFPTSCSKRTATIAHLAAILALCPMIRAGDYFPSLFSQLGPQYDLASQGITGSLGPVVAGDLWQEGTFAMVQLVGSTPYYTPMPTAMSSVYPVDTTLGSVSGLTFLEGQVGLPASVLLTSGVDGLCSFAPDSGGTWTFAPRIQLDSGTWVNTVDLSTFYDAERKEVLLAGLSSDRSTLHVASVGSNAVAPLTDLLLPIQIQDYALADWDGDGGYELVVACTYGLFVYAQDGSLLQRLQLTGTTAAGVVRLGTGKLGSDEVFWWWVEPDNVTTRVAVADASGEIQAFDLDLDVSGNPVNPQIQYGRTGDYNEDGEIDVLLGTGSHYLAVLLNQKSPSGGLVSSFDVSDTEIVTWAPGSETDPLVNGNARAAFLNLNGEPGAEILLPVDELDAIEVFSRIGLVNGSGSQVVGGSSSDIYSIDTSWNVVDAVPSGTGPTLDLLVNFPLTTTPNLDQVQIAAFYQVDDVNGTLTSLATEHVIYDINDPSVGSGTYPIHIRDDMQALLPATEWDGDPVRIWVCLRFLEHDGSGALVGHSPWKTAVFSLWSVFKQGLTPSGQRPGPPGQEMDDILTYPGLSGIPFTLGRVVDSLANGTGTYVGTFAPTYHVPPYDDPPTLPSPTHL